MPLIGSFSIGFFPYDGGTNTDDMSPTIKALKQNVWNNSEPNLLRASTCLKPGASANFCSGFRVQGGS